MDLPQLFTELERTTPLSVQNVRTTIGALRECRQQIRSIHIWGKKRNPAGRRVAHQGNLLTYFGGNQVIEGAFLEALHDLLDDGIPRYLVPEVNSNDADLASIVSDMRGAGFTFV